MLDRALVTHCSPTLARLKVGSLFTYRVDAGFYGEFAALRKALSPKGITLTVLRMREGIALIYLYRRDALSRTLSDDGVWAFLGDCGYRRRDVDHVMRTLRRRLSASEGFPHEIGIFLGYPLQDVIGFIENEGRNCLLCGCWKVYGDACAARRAFERFQKCKSVYERLFASGCPLTQLAVAERTA